MTKIQACVTFSIISTILISMHAVSFSQNNDFKPLDSENSIKQKIEETAVKINSIQCDFKQIKKMQYLDSDLKSSGKFWYIYPDKIRWEYTEPYDYIIIINQDKISLISNNNTNQFEINSNETFNKMNELIVSAVSGKVFGNSEYKTKIYENVKFYKIVLQPGSSEITQMIKQMEIFFDKSSYTIKKLKIIEPNTDYSMIHFSNQKLNESIPENIFIP